MFQITYQCIKENLNGLNEAELFTNPQPGGNNAAWILAHILVERDTVLGLLGCETVIPEAERQLFLHFQPSTDKNLLPTATRLFELFEQSQKRIYEALDRHTVESLDQIVPAVKEGGKPDRCAHKILFFHFHESYHTGQLGLLRRILGKEGAI